MRERECLTTSEEMEEREMKLIRVQEEIDFEEKDKMEDENKGGRRSSRGRKICRGFRN